MMTFLAGLVGPKTAKILPWVLGALALVAFIWWMRADAYSDGVKATDAAWKAAGEKALKDAAVSSEAATRNEVGRLLDHQAKVEEEKEAIDAAIANGASPLDALFPAAGNSVR